MAIKRKKQSFTFPLKETLLFLLPVFNLLVLYLLKYRNQEIPIANFNISYTGNALNLFFTVVFLFEIIILTIRDKGSVVKRYSFPFKGSLIHSIFLVITFIVVLLQIHIPGGYVLGYPVAKIFLWFLFFSGQFIQFILISYSGLLLFRSNSLLFLRTLINSVFIAIILLGFVFLYTIGTPPMSEKNEPAGEVGVVLGAAVWSNNVPSTILMERLNKARELYEKKKIAKIQLTGGKAPGELSEAEVAYKYLTKFSIDPKNISVEKNTTSTTEQIRFIKNELYGKRNLKKVVIISDRFHLKRINEISKFYNLKVKLSGSNVTLNSKSLVYYKLRESIALINFWFFAI